MKFFKPHDKNIEYIYFINNRQTKRFSGSCYVIFDNKEHAQQACAEKHKKYIGERYIDVYENAGKRDYGETDGGYDSYTFK